MNSKPILFSTEMVRAILDGRKKITRRILKANIALGEEFKFEYVLENKNKLIGTHAFLSNGTFTGTVKCPYGNVGDELWVKETFCIWDNKTLYKADQTKAQTFLLKWKPSLFMPKERSRIILKITNIRVERLQNISNKDAELEGASNVLKVDDFKILKDLDWIVPRPFLEYQFGFLALWCKINGTDSWLSNPFVWIIDFEIKEVKDA